MARRVLQAFILVIAACLVLAAGCRDDNGDQAGSADTEGGEAGEELEREPLNSPGALAEDWINFLAFVKIVDSAEWNLGGGTVRYNFSGMETIDGQMTDKISVLIDEGMGGDAFRLEAWVDERGSITGAVLDGRQLEPENYGFVRTMAVPPLLPFELEGTDPAFNSELKRALAGQNVAGWIHHNWEESQDLIDGKPADIYDVLLENAAFGSLPASFTYADLGPFRIMLSLELLGTTLSTESLVFR